MTTPITPEPVTLDQVNEAWDVLGVLIPPLPAEDAPVARRAAETVLAYIHQAAKRVEELEHRLAIAEQQEAKWRDAAASAAEKNLVLTASLQWARENMRCERNGHLCGTDTFPYGQWCSCRPCTWWRETGKEGAGT
jgi:hypothetical protein